MGDIGDLTYPYNIIENKTNIIKDIVSNKHELSNIIKKSNKPLIIVGPSVLKMKSGKYIF